eukprot:CAMPEP_0197834556 /NCGR_PEP_ID=MMETSP1437-20131217/22801_1 /TAXON_ID=49252 ORGANISM="Eucampia antarctica, Strain CCMP1452" /NCGR_SAMPLE_ID=MMETSP1437 /ASSEMBLY_ACC=CAM_ASM_001096 /LENGTH=339 /DNA_ID=CAMNT_0043439327 /DNA_START=104 /DNA_END=1123 /DNA_ORIENTATION=+
MKGVRAARSKENPNLSALKQGNPNQSLEFASPLQTLTLFSSSSSSSSGSTTASQKSPRQAFLPKFAAGLAAERRVKERIAAQRKQQLMDQNEEEDDAGDYSNEWDKRSEEAERRSMQMEELRMERAHDRAIAKLEDASTAAVTASVDSDNKSKYQFVGVIKDDEKNKIEWFAAKKKNPKSWNVRLVHVNKDALIRDLFVRGKVDVYGKYVNTGKIADPLPETQEEGQLPSSNPKLGRPLIEAQYSVRERSWRNIWNFNPKHLLSDSSGSFWRERRLSPGLYTDGRIVYESTYRYSDGKNGMKPVSTLETLLKSKAIAPNTKNKLLKRLRTDSPDVVVEE